LSGKSLPTRTSISLNVNGKKIQVDVDARMTLAEMLREELGLTGTKVGCNRAECGSCTVILDGNAVYSCTVLAVEVGGREVQTIEGLADNSSLHPLQEAFIEEDALQCGYCIPGMVMSVKSLLDSNPHPTENDVRRAIDGTYCRCGSNQNILKAALVASAKMANRKSAE
jgi:aerobic-type carbon monoxide dehydrogenase small subunit (CoxS/CutS family)